MQPEEKFVRCLLDQKDEESRRARRLRQRTLLISILIQALVLTLLLLRPLFGGEEIRLVARLMPLPSDRGGPAGPAPPVNQPAPRRTHQVDMSPLEIRFPFVPTHAAQVEEDAAPEIDAAIPGLAGGGPGDPNGLIPIPGAPDGARPMPPPPPTVTPPPPPGRISRPSEVQEAMIMERVEPQYPPLALQAHMQGTVEVHAIIAKDGRIASAEIVSGNAVLAKAALSAVLRWRYRPTLLNGQAVEVETTIRVIFKLS